LQGCLFFDDLVAFYAGHQAFPSQSRLRIREKVKLYPEGAG